MRRTTGMLAGVALVAASLVACAAGVAASDASAPDAAVADLALPVQVAIALACPAPAGETGPLAAAAEAQFERDLMAAVCQREAACGQIARTRVAGCNETATSYLPLNVRLDEAVAAGRMAFSPEAARACLDRWRRDDCLPGEARFDVEPANGLAQPSYRASPWSRSRRRSAWGGAPNQRRQARKKGAGSE